MAANVWNQLPRNAQPSEAQPRVPQMSYSGYDRGLVAGGIENRPCSQKFLNRILADLFTIKAKCILGDKDQHFSDNLQAVLTECDRLREHPELFADGASAKRFLMTVYCYAKEIIDFAEAWKRLDEKLEALFSFNVADHPARPARPDDYDHYKPWASYLGPGAPGSGVRVNVTDKDARLQVIPEAGLKLLEIWSAETAHVAKRLRQKGLLDGSSTPVQPPFVHAVGTGRTYKSNGVSTNITPIAFRVPIKKLSRCPAGVKARGEPLCLLNEALARVGKKRPSGLRPGRLNTALVTRWHGSGVLPPIECFEDQAVHL